MRKWLATLVAFGLMTLMFVSAVRPAMAEDGSGSDDPTPSATASASTPADKPAEEAPKAKEESASPTSTKAPKTEPTKAPSPPATKKPETKPSSTPSKSPTPSKPSKPSASPSKSASPSPAPSEKTQYLSKADADALLASRRACVDGRVSYGAMPIQGVGFKIDYFDNDGFVAVPTGDAVFPGNQAGMYIIGRLDFTKPCGQPQPETKTELVKVPGDWGKYSADCKAEEFVKTREVKVYEVTYEKKGKEWVEVNRVLKDTKTETKTKPFGPGDKEKYCQTDPGPKPEPKTGQDVKEAAPVCVTPQGGGTVEVTTTPWSQDWKLVDGEWVLDTKVYGTPVTTTRPATAEECPEITKPYDKVEYTDWVKQSQDCEARTVVETRTKTVTAFVWDAQAKKWVLGTSVTTTETQTRAMTADEAKSCEAPPVEGIVPEKPGWVDECEPLDGDVIDGVIIPVSDKGSYVLDGKPVTPGFYTVEAATAKVTFVPNEGVTVKKGAETEWTFEFTKEACEEPEFKELAGLGIKPACQAVTFSNPKGNPAIELMVGSFENLDPDQVLAVPSGKAVTVKTGRATLDWVAFAASGDEWLPLEGSVKVPQDCGTDKPGKDKPGKSDPDKKPSKPGKASHDGAPDEDTGDMPTVPAGYTAADATALALWVSMGVIGTLFAVHGGLALASRRR